MHAIVRTLFIAIATPSAVLALARAGSAETAPPQPAVRAAAEILPPLELLSGTLAHTDWMSRRGPVGGGHPYFRELKAHFAPHVEHQAMQLVRQMIREGFTYDTHATFALCLGPLPELNRVHAYPPDLIRRVRSGEPRLEELRAAMRDLAAATKFSAFVERHAADYAAWCAAAQFDRERAIRWLETFFGATGHEFHLILAPAMFPSGGYGPHFGEPGKPLHVYQVQRADARKLDKPTFMPPLEMEGLAVHEWGHSFVNPALEAHPEFVRKLMPHFQAVGDKMKAQAYGVLATYANEQVLRACVIMAMREFHNRDMADRIMAAEERRGFLLTRVAVRQLERYQASRREYPTFASFVPELLASLAQEPAAPAPTR